MRGEVKPWQVEADEKQKCKDSSFCRSTNGEYSGDRKRRSSPKREMCENGGALAWLIASVREYAGGEETYWQKGEKKSRAIRMLSGNGNEERRYKLHVGDGGCGETKLHKENLQKLKKDSYCLIVISQVAQKELECVKGELIRTGFQIESLQKAAKVKIMAKEGRKGARKKRHDADGTRFLCKSAFLSWNGICIIAYQSMRSWRQLSCVLNGMAYLGAGKNGV